MPLISTTSAAPALPRTAVREVPNGPHQGKYRVWCGCGYRSEPMGILCIAESAQRAHEGNHYFGSLS